MDIEDKVSCCNIYLWNALIAFVFAMYCLKTKTELHTVFAILISLAVVIVYFIGTQIKYFRVVLSIAVSGAWAYEIAELICDIGSLDNIWKWFIRVVAFLIVILMHIAFMNHSYDVPSKDSDDDINVMMSYYEQENEKFKSRQGIIQSKLSVIQQLGLYDENLAQSCEDYNKNMDKFADSNYEIINKSKIHKSVKEKDLELLICNLISMNQSLTVLENAVERYLKNVDKENYSDSDNTEKNSFNPFAGCNNVESLKKRYKALCKSFHPDMSGGDTESMQFINTEYEKLLAEFEKRAK